MFFLPYDQSKTLSVSQAAKAVPSKSNANETLPDLFPWRGPHVSSSTAAHFLCSGPPGPQATRADFVRRSAQGAGSVAGAMASSFPTNQAIVVGGGLGGGKGREGRKGGKAQLA